MARDSEAIVPSGSDLVATVAQTYTFSPTVLNCQIFNINESPDRIYGRWNKNTCSPTNWDFYLDAGDAIPNPPGEAVTTVTLYSATNLTLNTHFIVKGYLPAIQSN